jgi:hypothetical protein
MRRIAAFIVALFVPLCARAQSGMVSPDEVLRAIADETRQRFPGDASYDLLVPTAASLNVLVGSTELRWMTHPDETFVCARTEGVNACINCFFDCRRPGGVQRAASKSPDGALSWCPDGYEPVCTAEEGGQTMANYRVPAGTKVVEGFFVSPPDVLLSPTNAGITASGGLLVSSTGASREAEYGGPGYEGYFYRYWDQDAVVRSAEPGVQDAKGAWSPLYPRICHANEDVGPSSYEGVKSNLEDAKNQFATGPKNGSSKIGRSSNWRKPSNTYFNFGGTGADRMDLYAIQASYSLETSYTSDKKDDYPAQQFEGTYNFPVYRWKKGLENGKRCLRPVLEPAYSAPSSTATTRALYADEQIEMIKAGTPFISSYGAKIYNKLPCGLLAPGTNPPDTGSYVWDKTYERYVCDDTSIKKITDDVSRENYWTTINWAAKFPGGSAIGGSIRVRQCFTCETMSSGLCPGILAELAGVICGRKQIYECGRDAAILKKYIQALTYPRIYASRSDMVPPGVAPLAPPDDEVLPVILDCLNCRRIAECNIRAALFGSSSKYYTDHCGA